MKANLLTKIILNDEDKDNKVAYIAIEGNIENATNIEKEDLKLKLNKAFDHILGIENKIPEEFENNDIKVKVKEIEHDKKDIPNNNDNSGNNNSNADSDDNSNNDNSNEMYEIEVYNSYCIRKTLSNRNYIFNKNKKAWTKQFKKNLIEKEKHELSKIISEENIKIIKKEEENV